MQTTQRNAAQPAAAGSRWSISECTHRHGISFRFVLERRGVEVDAQLSVSWTRDRELAFLDDVEVDSVRADAVVAESVRAWVAAHKGECFDAAMRAVKS